jgi:hypothetical protein
VFKSWEEVDKESVDGVVGSGIGGGRLPPAFVDVGDGTVHVAFCVIEEADELEPPKITGKRDAPKR